MRNAFYRPFPDFSQDRLVTQAPQMYLSIQPGPPPIPPLSPQMYLSIQPGPPIPPLAPQMYLSIQPGPSILPLLSVPSFHLDIMCSYTKLEYIIHLLKYQIFLQNLHYSHFLPFLIMYSCATSTLAPQMYLSIQPGPPIPPLLFLSGPPFIQFGQLNRKIVFHY